MENITMWAGILGIPSIVSGCMLIIFGRYSKRSEERDAAARRENILMMKSLNANGALAEATALAVINQKVNGEMDTALKYYTSIKHELRDFLIEQNAESIHGGE